MSTMPETEVFVTLGVDTHKHTHLAVALDQLGRRLGELEIPTTTGGFAELYAWASELGTIETVGIEGTGAYGAGLTRWLRERGVVVVEVERPDRKLRRNAGKSDPIDAPGPWSHASVASTSARSPRVGGQASPAGFSLSGWQLVRDVSLLDRDIGMSPGEPLADVVRLVEQRAV